MDLPIMIKIILKIYLLLLFTFFVQQSHGQIIIDDLFEDWSGTNVNYQDKIGDGGNSGIDFTTIKLSNDQNFLFVYFEINTELNLQSSNNLQLLIDIDDNINTGQLLNGIGVDFIYEFGRRTGSYIRNNFTYRVSHSDVGLVSGPTVTSDRFEVAIRRNFSPGNQNVVLATKIKLMLHDSSVNGDRAPDEIGGISYQFDNNIIFDSASGFSLDKSNESDIRFLAYNVLRDQLLQSRYQIYYNRILKAIEPDIIGFSEIYEATSLQVANFIESILPLSANKRWYHAGVNPDIRIISKYPILSTMALDGNGAFLLDRGADRRLLVIVTHLPCCENEISRQAEVDKIMSFIRSVKFGISSMNVPLNTPIVIMGDKNFVGLKQQLQTLISGDIVDNLRFGVDFRPDWDNSDLDDVRPQVTGLPLTFTWASNASSYSYGRLDYMLYTGSVMEQKNAFALWTKSLTAPILSKYGLSAGDIESASDHLPIVADFTIKSDVSQLEELATSTSLPFNMHREGDQIFISSKAHGNICIVDVLGRVRSTTEVFEGVTSTLNIGDVEGVYFLIFKTKTVTHTLKLWN